MFTRNFKEELGYLKEAAAEYGREHPELAPMLGEAGTDPDVERLFEGVAFLNANIKEKLDDDFPEIIYELLRMLWPHYMRALPASTIIQFTTNDSLTQAAKIPAGVYIDSGAKENTPSCRFRTCYDVEIHPLELLNASFEEPANGMPASIKFSLELKEINLSLWEPESLSFFLAGDYRKAADLYMHMRNNISRITIGASDNNYRCSISSDHLAPLGYSEDEALFPYPSNSFKGHRLLQEYFFMPSKFLFLKLSGWENWINRGEGTKFEIYFELKETPTEQLHINKKNIAPFANLSAPFVDISFMLRIFFLFAALFVFGM